MTPDSSLDTVRLHAYVERFRAGDRAATDAFLRHVCGRLERLARSMLRGFPNVRRWADTDDVLQSALMRLLRTLQGTQPESTRHFAKLAALHIRRELLDLARHFRNRLDRPAGAADSQDGEGAGEPVDPNSAVADDLSQWDAFHEQVDQLPVEEREVVSLKFYDGPVERQLARVWGIFWLGFFLTALVYYLQNPGSDVAVLFPVLLVEFGITWGCTAAILGGSFYVLAAACAVMALLEATLPNVGPILGGVIGGTSLVWIGRKHSRRAPGR